MTKPTRQALIGVLARHASEGLPVTLDAELCRSLLDELQALDHAESLLDDTPDSSLALELPQ